MSYTPLPKDTVTGAVQVNPVLQQDLIGNVKSGPVGRTRFSIIGRNPAVNNAFLDLWEGPTASYVFPAAAQQMRIVSTSANDTLAGSGVQKVLIHYLDANYAVQTEIVSMSGVTPVNTVATNILRINGLHAVQVGSGGAPAGAISLTNLAASVTYGYVAVGENLARQAVFTVPAASTGYISQWKGSSGTATGTHYTRMVLRATSHDGVVYPGVFIGQDETGTLNGSVVITLVTPIPLPAQTDVKISTISDAGAANAITTGSFNGWYE